MQRFLYFAGFVYIALCGTFVVRQLAARASLSDPPRGVLAQPPPSHPVPSQPAARGSGAQWFTAMKQYCNPVEVDVRVRYTPPPATSDGAGYAAACFALAGKIDRARTIIGEIAPRERAAAASVLFEVAHPVADAGDDRASGPMMELVIEYWPNNYMALYHAGMSEYSLGANDLAEKHLRAFLELYTPQDAFTSNARQALESIGKANASASRLRGPVERDSSAVP